MKINGPSFPMKYFKRIYQTTQIFTRFTITGKKKKRPISLPCLPVAYLPIRASVGNRYDLGFPAHNRIHLPQFPPYKIRNRQAANRALQGRMKQKTLY
jgi:hypothetical protein